MSIDLTAALRAFPRIALAYLPTPIEPLHRFSALLGGPTIWVKRDDLTGLALGGNKVRKLEFYMGEALAQGAEVIITAGALQSNHARQTAAAARKCGLEPHLVLRAPGGKAPSESDGNVLLDELLGAVIHWTEESAPYTESIARVERDVRGGGKVPYVVPYGGSGVLGALGYVAAMQELTEDMADLSLPHFDAHVFATSSGGMQAGLILGAHLTDLLTSTRLLGISVDQRDAVLGPRIANLVNEASRALSLDWRVNDDVADINDDYLGGGYAVVGEPEREAIRLLAQSEGLLVDPVYTGRALAGLIDLIRRGEFSTDQRVLFWHSGGQPALFAFNDSLR